MTDFYIPARRTRWVTWDGEQIEGQPPFKALIRSDLTFGEVDELKWSVEETDSPELAAAKKQTSYVHDLFAPYVLKWNVGTLDDEGNPVAAAAPAETGGDAFHLIPNEFFWWLVREIKFGGVRVLDPKPSTPAASTVAPSSESASASQE